MTALYGVIGDPIAQSLSPLIHNGWMQDEGLDAEYRAIHVPADEFSHSLKKLEKQAIVGLNITMPHKLNALDYADEASEKAIKIGAANTLSRTKEGGWRADNTDAPGILADLKDQGVTSVDGQTVFVLGAGGAARAVVYALVAGKANVIVCNRTESKAELLAKEFHAQKGTSLEEGLSQLSQADIVINTASLGFTGGSLALPEGNGRLFHEISYGKAAAGTLEHASSKGWKTADGLGMLVHQAAVSFKIWTGISPSIEKAKARVRKAVELAK